MSRTDSFDRITRWAAYRATYRLRSWGFAPDLNDALAGASYGAWRAAQSYDPTKGASLTSWSFPWIKRYADLWAKESAGLTSRGDGPHLYRWSPEKDDRPAPDNDQTWTDRVAVREAARRLPDNERLVLWLLYWEDVDQRTAAERMSLSRARIRALHDRALEHMRQEMAGNNCKVCGKADYRKPMCFRGVPWCCELHRKVVHGEMTREEADKAMRGEVIRESEVMR